MTTSDRPIDESRAPAKTAGPVLIMTGQNHRTTPVEIRERLAFDEERAREAIRILRDGKGIHECVVISTCNRSEVYAVTDAEEKGLETLESLYRGMFDVDPSLLASSLYRKSEAEAVRQLFTVTAGLDSMVLGEPQIFGQVKDSFALASSAGATRILLNRLFAHAFEVGKRVRTETAVGAGAVSVSFAAVEVVRSIFDRLDTRTAVVIGAGEAGVLAAKHLKGVGVRSIVVLNRTFERAAHLAGEVGGTARRFEELEESIAGADVVISCTSAPQPILTVPVVKPAVRRRKNAPLFLIDLAVPRDIDPAVGKLAGLFLYDVDDLKVVVDRNRKKREEEAEKARKIIAEETALFHRWLASLDTTDTIRKLRGRFNAIGEAEVLRFTRNLPEERREELRRFTRGLLNKILHHPTVRLKKLAEGGGDPNDQRLVRDLFHLDDEEER